MSVIACCVTWCVFMGALVWVLLWCVDVWLGGWPLYVVLRMSMLCCVKYSDVA